MTAKRKNSYCHGWCCVLLLILSSCNVVKFLKPDEKLYTGAEIKVVSRDRVDEKQVRKEMENILRPKPNQTIGGVRFKLWFWYKAGDAPKKGFRKWLKEEAGERPVFYNPQIPLQVSDIMVNRLNNLGYFDAAVNHTTVTKDQKTKVLYEVKVTRPYRINRVSFVTDSSELGWRIRSLEEGTLLKQGQQYSLDLVRAERQRIDQELKKQGFYFFNPDYLLVKADSTAGEKTMNMVLIVKPDVPSKALRPYFINEVYINTSHTLRDSSNRRRRPDTIMVDNFHYTARDSAFHPRAITRAVYLVKGERYSREAHSRTLKRLMGMGVFHYANIKFSDTVVNGKGALDTYINLTPMQKRSLQAEIQAVTKSNNYSGPALTLSYRNRNQMRHAELFVFNLNTNYETQFTGIQKGFNSYEIGANSQLYLQRFLVPFRLENVSSTYIPRTKFDIGVRNLNRVLYFSMHSVSFTFGYTWKESEEKDHEFNPVAINFARVRNTTTAFEELLDANPFLRNSFEQQFTLGSMYAFTYNSLTRITQKRQYYYNGIIDLSGNTASLVHRVFNGRGTNPDRPNRVMGFAYSQYAKIANDLRYHHTFNKNSKLASRLIVGAGFPYGNSRTMPYIKQFFSGGSTSLRAFLPRTVGPGAYITPDSLLRRRFLDQAGDIKLEGNLEYRFTMISVLKGAVFLDAGNVWLLRKTDQIPGGEFNPKQFYRQLAVGSGFGVRLDVTYFVLRFDIGVALRKPYLPFGERWVIRQMDFSEREWRRQNMVLNIAIGYPF